MSLIYVPGQQMNPATSSIEDLVEHLLPQVRAVMEAKAPALTLEQARFIIDSFASQMQAQSNGGEVQRLASIGYPAFSKEVWVLYTDKVLLPVVSAREERPDIVSTWLQLYAAARALE